MRRSVEGRRKGDEEECGRREERRCRGVWKEGGKAMWRSVEGVVRSIKIKRV